MIKILQRYIAKSIIAATAMTALVVTGIMFLLTFLSELKNIGEGDYGVGQALFYVLLRMPNQLYQFSPLLLLLGSIIGLSLLSSSRELIVMRSSGFAVRRIIFSVLGTALFLILMISIVGEWIGPDLSSRAEIQKENAQNAGQAVVTSAGVWFHLDNNFIHVRQVVGRQLLEDVTRYQFDDNHQLQEAYYAKSLSYLNHQWVMTDVAKTSFYDDRTKSQSFAQLPWNLKFNQNLFNIGLVEPNEMSLPKLLKFERYLEQNGLQATQYQYNFWLRVFQPLAALVMIFLAIPFVLGVMSTSTMGWRIIVGIMVGFTFYILNAFLGQLCIVYQVPALLAAMVPLILFILLGILLSNSLIRR
jgi:lipopolysaccharide export system permease protein